MRAFAATIVLSVLARLTSTQSIDPNSVPLNIRQNWCQSQTTSCPLLCLQFPGEDATTQANDCDADNLTYDCVCDNGQSPNASEYSQTLPFYICQEWGNQCVSACNGDTTCQTNCRTEHPCGAQNPKRVNVSTTTSAPTAGSTSTSTGINTANYNGFGASPTGSSSSNSKGAAATAMNLGQSYGLAVILSGLFAGFALVL